jgi:saccharopine dehydrogenase (NAD+, L-lysine-forming)
MSPEFTFGIVGGYGASGAVVASELAKSCDGTILLGGRDLAAAKAFADRMPGSVSAARLDILDVLSLDDFCSRCVIIVNCAGPVMMLQDRVAQAAFGRRCHYIDAAGMSMVKERLSPFRQTIADLGLSFVISAGWMPGISELLPVYAHAQARATMDTIESLTVYFGDSGNWSESALRDGVRYIRQKGLRPAGYFHQGEWTRSTTAEAFRTVDLGDSIGSRRFAQFFTDEMSETARRLADCDVRSYTYLSGFRTVRASSLMALLPLPERIGVRLLRSVFRSNRLPVSGFVAAQVAGRSQGRPLTLNSRIVFQERRDYWIHGVTLATVARLIAARRGVQAGVHFLADAVEPVAFMAELRNAGVEQEDENK